MADALSSSDTIVALSSGLPPAAIGVIRISGPAAAQAIVALSGTLPDPRRASLRTLRNADGTVLDSSLLLWFPGSQTATGEPLAEIQCHGGRAVIDGIIAALLEVPGCRRALPGEFTRRALTNGRIDLSEAEGLADLLAAETEQQRRAAILLAEGGLSRMVTLWMAEAAAISALVEVEIDYVDEDDLAFDMDEVGARSAALVAALDEALRHPTSDRLREGFRVVLAGPPNEGKSSLLNRLACRDAAIVTPIAGTTRDVIEVPVTHDGLPLLLVDTAGLHTTDDPVERIGVSRARQELERADLILWLGDDEPPRVDVLWLYPRSDVRDSAPAGRLGVSVNDDAAIAQLWLAITAPLRLLLPGATLTLSNRHHDLLKLASRELNAVLATHDALLRAEHLRLTRRYMGEIIGVDPTDTMLDQLFSRFCLGK